MNEHHYQRIDKGVKRRPNVIEREAREQARDNQGKFLPICTTEKRSEIILEAIEALRIGIPPKDIAEKHGIAQSTIYSWLIVNPEASQARAEFFSERLGNHLRLIETASDPLELGRAREAYRAWADIAAKRDPSNYGQKQEITHIQADLGDRLRRARERVIDQEVTVIPPKDIHREDQHTCVMSTPSDSPSKLPEGPIPKA